MRRCGGHPPDPGTPRDPPAVVILTAFETDDFVLGALTAGAAGFLLKHTPPADLVAGITRPRRAR